MHRILHLSDLHFGASHHFYQSGPDEETSTLAQAIRDALVNCPIPGEETGLPQLDALVISGDLFSNSAPKDKQLATTGVRRLLEALELSGDRVCLVPGNHDLTWDQEFAEDPLTFYKDLARDLGVSHLAVDGIPQLVLLDGKGGRPIALLLLDSCRLEGKQTAGMGRIGEAQLRRMAEQLGAAGVNGESHTILAVLHHHLLPIEPVLRLWDPQNPQGAQPLRASLTVDAVELLRRLGESRVAGVLHGHQHRSAVLHYKNMLTSKFPLHVFAAGSCGAQSQQGDNVARQFFFYEADSAYLTVWSYEQSSDYDSTFRLKLSDPESKRQDPVARIRLPQKGVASEKLCAAEFEVVADTAINIWSVERASASSSDLNYILLSVVDCPTSRRAIRTLVQGMDKMPEWHHLGASYFDLLGMYDLMGRWDLAVRFRADPRVNPWLIARLIQDRLEAEGMIEINKLQQAPPTLFDRFDLINVQREFSGYEARIVLPPGSFQIKHARLAKPTDYARNRCQRAFLYVHLPTSPSDREKLLDSLMAELRKDTSAGTSAIIESVAIGQDSIMYEVFMRCSQSWEINRLNSLIEGTLTRFHSQKYTLLCYGYDEEGISVRGVDRPAP
jgi:3',5'-cyclic AMP phosphodiesterase CpdA